jgi:hypothetical protein
MSYIDQFTCFTCFTSTKVQILTQGAAAALRARSTLAFGSHAGLKLLLYEALSSYCMRP